MKRKIRAQKIKKLTWIEIKHGEDLLNVISDYAAKNKIKAGMVLAIGALQKAKFGYYNQKEKKYYENAANEPVEIVSCIGNISIKDRKPFLHAHISVADKKGFLLGGHLVEGCIVFACECLIIRMAGPALKRRPDPLTGLSLWKFV